MAEGEITTEIFDFLPYPANAEVALVNPNAMPVVLAEPWEWKHRLTAPMRAASELQRPLPGMRILAFACRHEAPAPHHGPDRPFLVFPPEPVNAPA